MVCLELFSCLGYRLESKLPIFWVQFSYEYWLVEIEEKRGVGLVCWAHRLWFLGEVIFLSWVKKLVVSHLAGLKNGIGLAPSHFADNRRYNSIIIAQHTLIETVINLIFFLGFPFPLTLYFSNILQRFFVFIGFMPWLFTFVRKGFRSEVHFLYLLFEGNIWLDHSNLPVGIIKFTS